jgi:hypothetical protein
MPAWKAGALDGAEGSIPSSSAPSNIAVGIAPFIVLADKGLRGFALESSILSSSATSNIAAGIALFIVLADKGLRGLSLNPQPTQLLCAGRDWDRSRIVTPASGRTSRVRFSPRALLEEVQAMAT